MLRFIRTLPLILAGMFIIIWTGCGPPPPPPPPPPDEVTATHISGSLYEVYIGDTSGSGITLLMKMVDPICPPLMQGEKKGEQNGEMMIAPEHENESGEGMNRRDCCRPHFIRMIGDTSGSGST